MIYHEYFRIFIYILISATLAILIYQLSDKITANESYAEKLVPYECGFSAYEDARNLYDIKFYLVAIIFLLFDLELVYIYSWSVVLRYVSKVGIWSMIFFLVILTVGLIYEWLSGALDWS